MKKLFRLAGRVILFAILLVIEVNADNANEENTDWSGAYSDFVIKKEFLVAPYPYEYAEGELWGSISPWGEYDDYWVRLYNFDADGIPELMISNGYASPLDGKSYIYTYADGEIKYIGNTRPYPQYIPESAYTGIWGEWYTMYDDHTINYYWKEGNKINCRSVCQYDITEPEILSQTTENSELYEEAQKELKAVYGATPEEIITMGWESFVENALGENIRYENETEHQGEIKTVVQEADSQLGALFSDSSYAYSRELALMAAQLSDAAEDDDGSRIREQYLSLGFDKDNIYTDNYGESLAYSIADKLIEVNGMDTNLLVITARGSKTGEEFWKDFSTNATKDFMGCTAYDVVYDFEEEIWSGLEIYLKNHEYLYDGNLKVLITGHSLGGAAANLIAARFTRYADWGGWWSELSDKDDIYAYTFGAIDSIRVDSTIEKEFENIHNIYNFRDSFGPAEYGSFLPSGVGSIYGKLGHMDIFSHQYREPGAWNSVKFDTANHNMPSYIEAVRNNRVKCKQCGIRCIISCPVDVSVTYNGEIIGTIRDNEVVIESPAVPMMVIGESKYLLFEETDGYSVLLTATAGGEMSYSVEDLTETEAVIFRNISLEKGKNISVEMKDSLDEIKMYVVGNNGKIKKEIAADGSERNISSSVPVVIICVICMTAVITLVYEIRKRKLLK